MALIQCPECQHNVSDSALACPSCGYKLKESHSDGFAREVRSSIRCLNIVAWSLAVVGAIGLIFGICFHALMD